MKRNPFRARQISPGRLPYLFTSGHDIEEVVHRFVDCGLRGQIVGPHGTGKSTLLQNLAVELRRRDCQVLQVKLKPTNTSERLRMLRKKMDQLHLEMPGPESHFRVLTIDGCDVATWWERFRFFSSAHRAGWGILVTTHRDLGFPMLWETKVTAESARRVIRALVTPDNSQSNPTLHGEPELQVPGALIDELLARHHGDMREVLFSLYDWYRSSNQPPSGSNDSDN